MNQTKPGFFLTSSETYSPFEPRACYIIKRLAIGVRDDCMLVSIEPPIDGQKFRINNEIRYLILASRFKGTTLFPINEWPMYVYIHRIKNEENIQSKLFKQEDIEMILWGELYPTLDSAKKGKLE